MSDAGDPIAYTALRPGASVRSSDGQEFGTVESVLTEDVVDVFDGIVVRTADGPRFVDADLVGQIFTTHVLTRVPNEEVGHLPLPDEARATHATEPGGSRDGGTSLADRFRRLFGRGPR
jgi:hypothetical protein